MDRGRCKMEVALPKRIPWKRVPNLRNKTRISFVFPLELSFPDLGKRENEDLLCKISKLLELVKSRVSFSIFFFSSFSFKLNHINRVVVHLMDILGEF